MENELEYLLAKSPVMVYINPYSSWLPSGKLTWEGEHER